MFSEETRAVGRGTAYFIWFVIVLTIVSAVLLVVYRPWAMNQETQITRQSNQYVTTQQTALREFKSDYDELQTKIIALQRDPKANANLISGLQGQQKNLILRMKEVADTLQPDQVQPDVRSLIATQ